LEKREDYIFHVIIIMWGVLIVAVGRWKWSIMWSEAGEPA